MKHPLYLPTFLPVSFPDAMETFLEDMAKKLVSEKNWLFSVFLSI